MPPQNIASTAQDKPRRSSEVEPVHRPGVYIMSRAINDPNTAHEIRRNKVQRPAAIKKSQEPGGGGENKEFAVLRTHVAAAQYRG